MSKKKESGSVLLIVFGLLFFAITISMQLGKIIEREELLTTNKAGIIKNEYKLRGVEKVVRQRLQKLALNELSDDSLNKSDLAQLKKSYNEQENNIKLGEEKFNYELLNLDDNYGRVNLNQSTKDDLKLLPGVGEVLSTRIINNRYYERIEELRELDRFGPKRINSIKDLVTTYGNGKININTVNSLTGELFHQRLGFDLIEKLDSNRYNSLEELLEELSDENKKEAVQNQSESIRFNSDILWVEYQIERESDDKSIKKIQLLKLSEGENND